MQSQKSTTQPSSPSLFLTLPDTDFRDYLAEVDRFIRNAPEITAAIERDLDAHARDKKLRRIQDRQFLENQTADLSGLDFIEQELRADDLELETGRPRMSAHLVFLFSMLRGFLGSLTSRQASRFLNESISLYAFLQDRNLPMPAATTALDHVNLISAQTQSLIFDRQIEDLLQEELDDFKKLTIDSTAVGANSAWPTDGKILIGLLERIFRVGKKLDRLGLNTFNDGHLPSWLEKMNSLEFSINLAAGKKGAPRKRKKLYRKLLEKGEQAIAALQKEFNAKAQDTSILNMLPSRMQQIERVVKQLCNDLSDARRVVEYTRGRVFNDDSLPAKEKILSLSDGSAAYISKGQRDPVIGYKPQLVRSAQGFVTSLLVPEGNAADSAQLVPAIAESVQRTGVIAALVSTDDGYSSKVGRDTLIGMGINDISISGAKGKKITPPEEWDSEVHQEARNNRSAVESLMFTLKDGFEFGRVSRRGIEAVRSELTEKVLAYNFCRAIEIRTRKQKELRQTG
jgi:IS5 family transposase